MRIHVLSVIVCLSMAVLIGAQQSGRDTDEELARKIQKLRDQIEELQRLQDPLLYEQRQREKIKVAKEHREKLAAQRKEEERRLKEEAERKAKEEAERKKHVAKVEIRGLLVKGGTPTSWQVQINQLNWTLTFGYKKELMAEAEKLAGKGVVIKGTIANDKAVTIAPYGMGFPMPPIAPPNPFPPGWPQPLPQFPSFGPPQPQWGYYPYLIPVIVNVESIKLAQD